MRIEDVKVGDVVIPLPFEGQYDLPGGSYVYWSDEMPQFLGCKAKVVEVNADTSVKIQLPAGQEEWWPVEFCDASKQLEPAQALLNHLHEREKTQLQLQVGIERQAAEAAVRREKQLERDLAAVRTAAAAETKVLRNRIAQLEQQVADLKSERDRVGKTSQTGTRFAQLELD